MGRIAGNRGGIDRRSGKDVDGEAGRIVAGSIGDVLWGLQGEALARGGRVRRRRADGAGALQQLHGRVRWEPGAMDSDRLAVGQSGARIECDRAGGHGGASGADDSGHDRRGHKHQEAHELEPPAETRRFSVQGEPPRVRSDQSQATVRLPRDIVSPSRAHLRMASWRHPMAIRFRHTQFTNRPSGRHHPANLGRPQTRADLDRRQSTAAAPVTSRTRRTRISTHDPSECPPPC